jgi:hypothetical protein
MLLDGRIHGQIVDDDEGRNAEGKDGKEATAVMRLRLQEMRYRQSLREEAFVPASALERGKY